MNCTFRLTCTKYVPEINDQSSSNRVVTHHRVDHDSIPVVLFDMVTGHGEPAGGMDVQIISLAAGWSLRFSRVLPVYDVRTR